MSRTVGDFWSVVFMVLFTLTGLTDGGQAQQTSKQGGTETTRGPSPGFLVDELVKEVSGPVGSTVEFQFTVTSAGGERQLEVRPIGLVQERDGSISYSEEEGIPEQLSIDSEKEFTVADEESVTIDGSIDVTQEGSEKRYYGLFVYDRGRPVEMSQQQPGEEEPRIQVNYVTRYLLRVELTVTGIAFDNYDAVEVQEAGLQSRNGQAHAYAVLNNASDSAIDLRLRTQFVKESGRPLARPFFLALPIKQSRPEPERYNASILPRTDVVMRRQVPEPVLPGEYRMELTMLSDGRPVKSITRNVTVKENQFPGQDNVVSRIVEDVSVEPAQILFSRRPGGDRVRSVNVKNASDQTLKVQLSAHPRGDQQGTVDWLTYRPTSMRVPGGQSRQVFMSASGGENIHQYAFLEVSVEPTETLAGGQQNIPVAFLGTGDLNVSIESGQLQTGSRNRQPALLLPVKNTGEVHLTVDAEMAIDTPFGEQITRKGGFGRWILPGREKKIRFVLDEVPSKGTYPVTIKLNPGHGAEPVKLERTLKIE